jgi:hypothetical protein
VGIKSLKPQGKGQWALTIKGASRDLLAQTSSLWEYPGFSFKSLEGYAFVLGPKWRDRKKALNLEIPGYAGKWTATLFDEGKTLPGLGQDQSWPSPAVDPWCPLPRRRIPYPALDLREAVCQKHLLEGLRNRSLSINSLYTAELHTRGWVTLPRTSLPPHGVEAQTVGPYRVLKTRLWKTGERKIAKIVKQPGGIHRKEAFEELGIPRGLGEALLVVG